MTITMGWLALAVLAAIVEVLSPLFGYIFVTLAALVAAAASSAGFPLVIQIILFVVILPVSLLLLRPRLLAKLGARGIPSRTEALLGKTGVVTQTVDSAGTGRVTIAGEDWAAQSSSILSIGTPVRVDGADGITLNVSPSANDIIS